MVAAKRVRSGLRIPMNLNTNLILLAQENGISKNALILQILRDWVRENAAKGKDAS